MRKEYKNTKIIDATLRDGGLVNDFFFEDDFVRALYRANVAAGIDYMEFGYRADRNKFNQESFGKWKFAKDNDILNVIDNNDPDLKISLMVDVGRCDYMRDIDFKKNSPVDMFRVATYIETISEAINMIEYINSLGYETTCNIMAVSKCTNEQIVKALLEVAKTSVSAIYIVDSYGALYPKQIKNLAFLFNSIISAYNIELGIHAHNNQQCAFSNTIEALEAGSLWLDGTISGMGRGAGNCCMEALIGYLGMEKYNIEPILDFIQKWMIPLHNNGVIWGYNTSYLLTGLTNQHPRTAITATNNNDICFREQYRFLTYQ